MQANTLTYVFTVNTVSSRGFSEAKLKQNLLDAFDHDNLKKVCDMGNSQPGWPIFTDTNGNPVAMVIWLPEFLTVLQFLVCNFWHNTRRVHPFG
jgi:hypothetical protein